jgi:hypothetical protein
LLFAFLQLLKLGIFCRIAKVPSLDNVFLGFVDDLFVVDVLDANAETVFSEDDIFLVHFLVYFLGSGLANLLGDKVDLVGYPGDAGEDEERDNDGNEFPTVRANTTTLLSVTSQV